MSKTKGKLIVIEGSDGTGKETQSNFLTEYLNNPAILGFGSATRISFPDYESAEGKVIRRYLNGEFGDVRDVDPYDISPLYGVDRFNKKQMIEDSIQSGKVIVSDRYFESNAAYQGVKIASEGQRKAFYCHLVNFEYKILGIPVPDLTIMLRLDGDIAQRHLSERDQSDIHEQNAGYLDLVRLEYDRIASGYYSNIFPGYRGVIDCSEDGKQLPREIISDKIQELVSALF